ncbi:MAG: hypothetical protein AAGN82_07090 [Myxococcota bacterium]
MHHFSSPSALTTIGLSLAFTTSLVACGDDDDPVPTTASSTTASTGGSDGVGGMGGTGGGTGGTGAMGGDGAGGGATDCLPATEHTDDFAIVDPGLCVVAKYTTDQPGGTYTWGRHGGPMRVTTIDDVEDPNSNLSDAELTRLTPPAGMTTGTLAATTATYDLNIDAKGFTQFLGSEALDIPGTTGTILSYTNLDVSGEVRVFDGTTPAGAVMMVGFFRGTFLEEAGDNRLLYTGLTVLGDGDINNSEAGLYQTEFCAGLTLCDPPAPSLVDAWGGANAGVALDGAGNAFAAQGDAGDTVIRGFAATAVAPGAATPAAGVSVGSYAGFGGELAALAPSGDQDGYVFAQPQTFDNVAMVVVSDDVVAYRYDDTGGTITVDDDESAVVLDLAPDPNPAVALVNDDQGRLWVGAPNANGSTFYVLQRADP